MNLPEDNNRPLFTLTIKQFSDLLKRIIGEENEVLLSQLQEKNNPKNISDICYTDSACKTTGLEKSSLYSKVSLKEIPCLSRRRPLTFSQKHLELWIKAGRPKTNDLNRIHSLIKKEIINNCEPLK